VPKPKDCFFSLSLAPAALKMDSDARLFASMAFFADGADFAHHCRQFRNCERLFGSRVGDAVFGRNNLFPVGAKPHT